MAEVIIVGSGLAACCLMHRFAEASVSFTVISQPGLSSSSHVAAGIWNPVVFKRYTKSWMADTVLPEMQAFYAAIEQQSSIKMLYPRLIIRPLADEREKTLWLGKSKNELDEYLDSQLYSNNETFPGLSLPAEYGIVKHAGNLDLPAFLAYSTKRFKNHIIEETFEHSSLKISPEGLSYKNRNAKAVVFCEGWLIKNNPFFNWLPFKPAKGEVLTLSAEGLQLKNHISNRSSFLFEQQHGQLRCGATYEWQNLNEEATDAAREELLAAYATHTDIPARVTAHQAGVRPATIDRRPVLGCHPELAGLYVFNGLGSKGVMLAPYFSKKFVNFYLHNEALSAEVNVRRFYPIYEQSKLS